MACGHRYVLLPAPEATRRTEGNGRPSQQRRCGRSYPSEPMQGMGQSRQRDDGERVGIRSEHSAGRAEGEHGGEHVEAHRGPPRGPFLPRTDGRTDGRISRFAPRIGRGEERRRERILHHKR